MKRSIALAAALCCLLALAGCGGPQAPGASDASDIDKLDSIPFLDGQLYAVAYLGYEGYGELEDLPFYIENYLDDGDLPIHYFSKGEYYLIVPRYAGMSLRLYRNGMEMAESALVYEEAGCRPFIIQCNVSDIFSDATIQLTYQTETVEFSPYISLKDGHIVVGERGLDITRDPQ